MVRGECWVKSEAKTLRSAEVLTPSQANSDLTALTHKTKSQNDP